MILKISILMSLEEVAWKKKNKIILKLLRIIFLKM